MAVRGNYKPILHTPTMYHWATETFFLAALLLAELHVHPRVCIVLYPCSPTCDHMLHRDGPDFTEGTPVPGALPDPDLYSLTMGGTPA